MSTTDQSPALARATTSGPTGRVHSLPLSTSRSHAARLCATGSNCSDTADILGRAGGLARPAVPGSVVDGFGGQRFGRQREGDAERGAVPGRGVQAHGPAVRLDKPLDDRQAEPAAAGAAVPCLVGPVEALEDAAGLFRSQPWAVVGDLDD